MSPPAGTDGDLYHLLSCVCLSEGRSEVAALPYPLVRKGGHALDDQGHHVVPPPFRAVGVGSRHGPLLPSGGSRPLWRPTCRVDRTRVPVSALTVSPSRSELLYLDFTYKQAFPNWAALAYATSETAGTRRTPAVSDHRTVTLNPTAPKTAAQRPVDSSAHGDAVLRLGAYHAESQDAFVAQAGHGVPHLPRARRVLVPRHRPAQPLSEQRRESGPAAAGVRAGVSARA
jgi:hypothetical protein